MQISILLVIYNSISELSDESNSITVFEFPDFSCCFDLICNGRICFLDFSKIYLLISSTSKELVLNLLTQNDKFLLLFTIFHIRADSFIECTGNVYEFSRSYLRDLQLGLKKIVIEYPS